MYVVVMPTGAISADSGFDGEHNYYTHQGRRIHYAWTAKSGSLDSATRILSHEIVESRHRPGRHRIPRHRRRLRPGRVVRDRRRLPGTAVVDGITVWPYWSNQPAAASRPPCHPPGHPVINLESADPGGAPRLTPASWQCRRQVDSRACGGLTCRRPVAAWSPAVDV
jgi:hypothetical protein